MMRPKEPLPTISGEPGPNGRDSEGPSRREFMQDLVAASVATTLASSLLSETAWTAAASTATTAGRILSEPRVDLLTSVLDCLVPEGLGMPGAGRIGVASYVDAVMAASPTIRDNVMEVMAALPDPVTFRRLTEVEAVAALRRVSDSHTEAFDTLLQVTYTGNYVHPQVVAALGLHPDDLDYPLDRLTPAMLDRAARSHDLRRPEPLAPEVG